ncbi:MAG: hypothetical protein HOP33_22410 [Verrucomicrobia bacterium]|nr:hypothetical protein [Verrucomicrobiota bacterium]
MNDTTETAAAAGIGLAFIAIFFLVGLACYLFFCFCGKKICEKCGVQPGILIWIPIVQLVPLLEAAKLPVWVIVLFFIPLVNFITAIYMWSKICTARGKSGLLVVGVILLPIVFIPYLAFSE